jgi:regulatory protein
MLTIACIETAGPDRRARRLVFSDSSEPRTTSAAVVRALMIEPGMQFDNRELEPMLFEAELAQARERALRLLGYRERSEKELRTRLRDDGYPQTVVHRVSARMVETGLLDDERFARSWARARATGGYGPSRVSRELGDKGVDTELIAEAVREAFADQDPVARARAILGSAPPRTRSERDRAIRKLLRRGFSLSTALVALGDADELD